MELKKKNFWAMLNSKASVGEGDYLCLPPLHHKAPVLLSPGCSEKRCPIVVELQANHTTKKEKKKGKKSEPPFTSLSYGYEIKAVLDLAAFESRGVV